MRFTSNKMGRSHTAWKMTQCKCGKLVEKKEMFMVKNELTCKECKWIVEENTMLRGAIF